MAVTIGNLTGLYNSNYGDGGTYLYAGQTFVAAGHHMQSLELLVDAAGPVSSQYHLLITTVKSLPGGAFQPDQVLKEVSLTEVFDSDHSFHVVHVNLGGLKLQKGETYAFVIDTYVTKDGTPDYIEIVYNNNLYSGGFVSDLTTGTGRANDFNSNWDEASAFDFAFSAVFSDERETIIGTKNGELIDSSHAPKGQLNATDLDDRIFGNKGKDKVFGGDGFDYLHGGKDNDKLYGEDDGDVLVGSIGKDKLYGGDGEDCYVFDFKMSNNSAKKNFDKLYDFDVAEDAIYLDPDKFPALALGDLPDTDTHIAYQNNALFYDGIKFVEFKGAAPASLDEIHIVVAA